MKKGEPLIPLQVKISESVNESLNDYFLFLDETQAHYDVDAELDSILRFGLTKINGAVF
jgi:hypothetical protein